MRTKPVILFLFIFAGRDSIAQNAITGNIDSIVARAAKQFLGNNSKQALSIGIIQTNKTFLYNYGTTAEAKNQLPGNNTLYEIGSVTKTFTSLLLARAIVEKKVKAEDDIRKYLPGNYPNLEYAKKPIELIHLVNLTSGLPNNIPENPEAFKNLSEDSFAFAFVKLHKGYNKKKFFDDLRKVKLDTIPGSFPKHSNAAAQLLAYILENIYHQPVEELIKKYITGPLNMDNTFIAIPAGKLRFFVKGYTEKGLVMPYVPKAESVAFGIKSGITDMTKYIKFQLDERTAAVKMTHQVAWGDINSFSLGMNWFINKTPDGKLKIHDDGTTFGFTTYILLYPGSRFGIVLMTNVYSNTSNNKLGQLAEQIFEESHYTLAQRSSDGFGFSPSINMLLGELTKMGFDHAIEFSNELRENNPEFILTEGELNQWGYFLARKNKTAQAMEIFKLNVALYPDSWNVYDSYGEILLTMGQKEEAIKMYKKSIELNPNNEGGKKILEEISK